MLYHKRLISTHKKEHRHNPNNLITERGDPALTSSRLPQESLSPWDQEDAWHHEQWKGSRAAHRHWKGTAYESMGIVMGQQGRAFGDCTGLITRYLTGELKVGERRDQDGLKRNKYRKTDG